MNAIARAVLALALFAFPCLPVWGDLALIDNEKGKFQFFGFVKLDAVYQDGGVNGLTFPRYATAGDGNLLLTASHSRFGFKYNGVPLGCGTKTAATLEWDLFDPTSPNQMKFRLRQAFITLQKDKHTLLFGQSWDLFSPLGPNTLMTNGYLWQVGNVGFRHAQIRYTYSTPRLDVAVSLSDPASAAGWKSLTPVVQSRLGFKLGNSGKIQLGVSAIYGRENGESATAAFKNKVDIAGLGLDWSIPFTANFALKGEYSMGRNLTYAVSRAGMLADAPRQEFVGKKVSSFWTELLLTQNKLSGWLGYAFEDLTDEAQLASGELKKSSVLLAGAQFAPGSGLSFGLEYSHFLSSHHPVGKAKTNQFIFSTALTF